MKRRAFQIVVLLVLGAIVNVAVAWGCATFVRPIGPYVKESSGWSRLAQPIVQKGRMLDWIVERSDAFGMTRLRANPGWSDRTGAKGPEAAAICPYWSNYPQPLHDNSPTGLNMAAYGWPSRSLLFRWHIQGSMNPDGTFNPPSIQLVRAIELPDFKQSGALVRNISYIRALPHEPIWPGFAINTIFYAASMWAVFFAPGMVRRRIRRRRGRCPACAYPIGSSPVCTECGSPLLRDSEGEGMERNA